MLLQVRYMAAWSMALSTVRRYWMLFCDEMGTGPRWPFSNIWAAAAKASQEDICHQCPPSVRLPANQVISLLFLAGLAQKHRLSFNIRSVLQKQKQMHTYKYIHKPTHFQNTLPLYSRSLTPNLKHCTPALTFYLNPLQLILFPGELFVLKGYAFSTSEFNVMYTRVKTGQINFTGAWYASI